MPYARYEYKKEELNKFKGLSRDQHAMMLLFGDNYEGKMEIGHMRASQQVTLKSLLEGVPRSRGFLALSGRYIVVTRFGKQWMREQWDSRNIFRRNEALTISFCPSIQHAIEALAGEYEPRHIDANKVANLHVLKKRQSA